MTIALFGGRFDPVHNGHIAIAQEVLKVNAAQEVWFSVENQHQWRPIVVSSKDRIAMLRLATADNLKLKIDETPMALGGMTETIFVIRALKKTVQDKIVFLCGSDQLSTFSDWTHWKELENEVKFLIVARKGSPIVHVPPNCTVIKDPTYEPLEDSATRIRNLLKMGKSITGLVPEKVEGYILQHKLYT